VYYRSKENGIFNFSLYSSYRAVGSRYIATRPSEQEDVVEELNSEDDAKLFEDFIWASLQRVRDYIDFKDFDSFCHGRRQ